jgi:hypothetical protein
MTPAAGAVRSISPGRARSEQLLLESSRSWGSCKRCTNVGEGE